MMMVRLGCRPTSHSKTSAKLLNVLNIDSYGLTGQTQVLSLQLPKLPKGIQRGHLPVITQQFTLEVKGYSKIVFGLWMT